MNAWAAVGVGDPAPDPCDPDSPLYVYITGPTALNMGEYGTWVAHASGGTGTYSYKWYVDYGWGWGGPYGTQSSFSTAITDDDMDLRVDVTSGAQQYSDYHTVYCMNCNPWYSVVTAPNPAKDILNVTIDEEEKTRNEYLNRDKVDNSHKDKNKYSGDIIYTLYNNYGQVVYTNRTKEKRIRINTSIIPDGIYILKIVLKDGIITKQVVIYK